MTFEYTIKVNANIDSEDFDSHTMNKFASHKSLAKHLQVSLVTNFKVVQSAYEDAIRIEAISKTMEIVDLPCYHQIQGTKDQSLKFLFCFYLCL